MTPIPALVVLTIIASLAEHGVAFAPPVLHATPATRSSSMLPLMAVKTSEGSTSTTSRLKRIKAFTEWAKESGIQ
jgi:hypothetical protein